MDETTNQPVTASQRAEVEGLSTNLLRLVANPSERAVARGVDEPLVECAREVLAAREFHAAAVRAFL